ncbi:hypothetical protein HDV05_006297, partial [Chytridiales sp. JEL 0842]
MFSALRGLTAPKELGFPMIFYLALNDGQPWFSSHPLKYLRISNIASHYTPSPLTTIDLDFTLAVRKHSFNVGLIPPINPIHLPTDIIEDVDLDASETVEPESNVTVTNDAEYYYNRPNRLESIPLMTFFKTIEDKHYLVAPKRSLSVPVGKQLPVLHPGSSLEDQEYHYLLLLIKFKPHRSPKELLGDHPSYKEAYAEFLRSDPTNAKLAIEYTQLNTDYHSNSRSTSENDEDDETALAKNLVLADPNLQGASADRSADDDGNDSEYDESDDNVPIDETDAARNAMQIITDLQTITKINAVDHIDKTDHVLTDEQPPTNQSISFYMNNLVDNSSVSTTSAFGTSTFVADTSTPLEAKILLLQSYLQPVPFVDTSALETPRNISVTTPFPSISTVSQEFRLDFWQHRIFETLCRHLLHRMATDISSTNSNLTVDIIEMPQFIGWMGGEAGCGKSDVIMAIKSFAGRWGRSDILELAAYTNLAASHIGGKTIHTARAISIGDKDPYHLNLNVRKAVQKLSLIIVDEASMIDATLLAHFNNATRDCFTDTSPRRSMHFGGIHILLC